jgi:tRNA (guanosine-2'-O-)-methyltransferase
MGNHWKRWRDYMDELEEAMRMAGVELHALELESAHRNEREQWKRPQRDARAPQLVAKARDIPFFAELVEHAAELGPHFESPPAPAELDPWPPGVDSLRQDSGAGMQDPALNSPSSPTGGDPPARLRNAERALAHRTRSLVPVLEELVSPRNASAIVRSAEALGLQEIHFVDPKGVVQVNQAVTRMCQRWMDLRWHRNAEDLVAELRRRDYTLLAADFGPGSIPLHEIRLEGPTAVVLGSEQRGVSPRMRELADGLFHLPTRGFTSYLNVSATAAIALYELDQRLTRAGLRRPLPRHEQSSLRRAWYAILAGRNEARRVEYAAWAECPPRASALVKPTPSREKSREEAD